MKLLKNIDLSNFSTLKIGGKASYIYFPENLEDVRFLIKKAGDENKKLIPIGIGSNCVFKDGILNHIFVSTRYLKGLDIKENGNKVFIKAQAGVSFKELVSIVKKMNLEGFEFLSGIPASIGGATAMNAGAYGTEIFDLIEEVLWFDNDGNLIKSKKTDINYNYRFSQFQNEGFVYETTISLKKSNKNIKDIIKKHLLERNKKQPLNLPTTGSTYKNPKGTYAGLLLENLGFKGKRIGNVGFSNKHANFLVNYGGGTFKELMKILETAEKSIAKEYGIKLEKEIKIIG